MNLSILGQRLKDLEDSINKRWKLLKKYDDALLLEDNPRRQTYYEEEIDKLRESATQYQQEYDDLRQDLRDEPSIATEAVNSQLRQMATKLDQLLGGQRAIRGDLAQMRQALINRYDVGEQAIIASITEKLDQNQIALTQTILDGLDANQISESEMQGMLAVLEKRLTSISSPNNQSDAVLRVLKSPEIGFKHRLKVAIPLIPQLLPLLPSVDYEGELELGTGLDVKVVWEKLKAKLQGK
ncbi:hypothetical protein ACKFKF_24740 [Phormidesmis sp. 146-12]